MKVDSEDKATTLNNTTNQKLNNEDEIELSFASFYYSLKVTKGKGKLKKIFLHYLKKSK